MKPHTHVCPCTWRVYNCRCDSSWMKERVCGDCYKKDTFEEAQDWPETEELNQRGGTA